MAALGISNIQSNQLVPPPCGKLCNECDPIAIYECAKRMTIDTGITHSIVELCEICNIAPATTVKYRGQTIYKLCAGCYQLLERAVIKH